MATRIWRGSAPAVAHEYAITPANVNIGNTFTVSFASGRAYTFTATAATVANVTAGLVALLQASDDPLVSEITYEDATTKIRATGPPGVPVALSSSASGGTATNTTTTVTAATGPNFWDEADNWHGGVVPASGDTVIAETDVPILYHIDNGSVNLNAAAALAELRIGGGQVVGLPEYDERGYSNRGYRPTYLECPATILNVRSDGGLLKFDTIDAATTVNVFLTGAATEASIGKALLWKGRHASNVFNLIGGSAAIDPINEDTATSTGTCTVATVRCVSGPDAPGDLWIGADVAVTTLSQGSGTVVTDSAITTVNKSGGDLTVRGSVAMTTINNDGGTVFYNSSGTITTYRGSTEQVVESAEPSKLDASGDQRPFTITNCSFAGDSEFFDPNKRATLTNAPTITRGTQSGFVLQRPT